MEDMLKSHCDAMQSIKRMSIFHVGEGWGASWMDHSGWGASCMIQSLWGAPWMGPSLWGGGGGDGGFSLRIMFSLIGSMTVQN